MVDKSAAKMTADAKVCETVLNDHTVEISDAGENWLLSYIPKGRSRGGGYEVTVSKQTGGVIRFVHTQ